MKAQLILENGTVFEGRAFGHIKESIGEVVFNTEMTGYQEVLTDPSYYGQIVTMTYPLIGNYGINLEDMESDSIKVKGLIVREKSNYPNNWRCELELDGYLKQNRVIGLEGIDTRALTKIIRNYGTMKGIITVRELTQSQINQKLKAFHNKNAVSEVTTRDIYKIEGSGKHIAVLDFGIKKSIINFFKQSSYQLTIFPADTSPEEILRVNPDGILLSNGPGNPHDLPQVIENIKKLICSKPILGIDLGCLLLTLSLGGKVEKLKYGHRGCNHPVKDLEKEKILITAQNHSYAVTELSDDMIQTHINLNDKSIEGVKHKKYPIFGVQFYPGDRDKGRIYNRFMDMMEGGTVCQEILA